MRACGRWGISHGVGRWLTADVDLGYPCRPSASRQHGLLPEHRVDQPNGGRHDDRYGAGEDDHFAPACCHRRPTLRQDRWWPSTGRPWRSWPCDVGGDPERELLCRAVHLPFYSPARDQLSGTPSPVPPACVVQRPLIILIVPRVPADLLLLPQGLLPSIWQSPTRGVREPTRTTPARPFPLILQNSHRPGSTQRRCSTSCSPMTHPRLPRPEGAWGTWASEPSSSSSTPHCCG